MDMCHIKANQPDINLEIIQREFRTDNLPNNSRSLIKES